MASTAGVITGLRFRNADNGYFIANYRDKETGKTGTIVGTSDIIGVGVEFRADGEHVVHPKFGPQFSAKKLTLGNGDTPPELAAIQALLASGFVKGIGPAIAGDFVRLHKDNSLAVLDKAINGDTFDLSLVPGMGKVTTGWAVQSWRERGHQAKSILLAIRAGLSVKQTKRALEMFGMEGLQGVILLKPYNLTMVRGITWPVADEIAKKEWPGKEPILHDSPQRYCAAVREVLRTEGLEAGHLLLPHDLALSKAAELATPPSMSRFVEAVSGAAGEEGLVYTTLGDENVLADAQVHTVERTTAKLLAKMIQRAPKPIMSWEEAAVLVPKFAGVTLSPDQEAAVRLALDSACVVITGEAGSGKTTIVNTICGLAEYNGHGVTLCAPTGKAANRLSKATERPAGTIHRILGVRDGETRYTFETSVVVVDEASMIDWELMYLVLKACTPGRTRLIMVGDANQLPPVGGGEPFYQIKESGVVPVARLSVIHRQGEGSGIVALAHGINDGNPVTEGYPDDMRVLRAASNESLQPLILNEYDRLVKEYGLDNVRLATPVNGKEWGQVHLNGVLQERYNPNPRPSALHEFRRGDPVIHIKNVYDMHKQVVFNGMVGKVVTVRPDSALAERDEWDDEGEPWLLAVDYDGDEIVYRKDEIEAYLRLAYGLTIHKLQGDEAPHVLVVMPKTWHGFMLRQLAYTGVTRARKTVTVISAQNALEVCAQNEERVRRYTALGTMLQEELS